MVNLLYIAAIVAAVAFLILCVSLAITLMSLKDTAKVATATLEDISGQMEGITAETTDLLHKTNELAADVQEKSEKLNSVVDAVRGVGTTVGNLNDLVSRVSNSVVLEAEKNSDKIAQTVQWGTVVIDLLAKMKEQKAPKTKGWKSYK